MSAAAVGDSKGEVKRPRTPPSDGTLGSHDARPISSVAPEAGRFRSSSLTDKPKEESCIPTAVLVGGFVLTLLATLLALGVFGKDNWGYAIPIAPCAIMLLVVGIILRCRCGNEENPGRPASRDRPELEDETESQRQPGDVKFDQNGQVVHPSSDRRPAPRSVADGKRDGKEFKGHEAPPRDGIHLPDEPRGATGTGSGAAAKKETKEAKRA